MEGDMLGNTSKISALGVGAVGTRFTWILNFIIDTVKHLFKGRFVEGEEFVLNYLQNHNGNPGYLEFVEFLKHTPMIYFYILTVAMLLSIFAIPYICCRGSCTQKTVTLRYPCCFLLEVSLFTLFLICLAFTSIALLEVGFETHTALMVLPTVWRNLVTDMLTNSDTFKTEVNGLIRNVKFSSDEIIHKTTMIPEDIVNACRIELRPYLDNNFAKTYPKYSWKEFGFAVDNDNYSYNSLEESINITISKTAKIRTLLKDLEKSNKITNSDLIRGLNFTHNYIKTIETLQSLDWDTIFKNFETVTTQLSFVSNHLLYVFDDFLYKISYYSEVEVNRVVLAARHLQVICDEIRGNVTKIIEELFPVKTQMFIYDIADKVDNYLSTFNISRNFQTTLFSNGNVFLMMIPSLYIFYVFIISSMALVFGTSKIRKIISKSNDCSRISNTECVLTLFRMSMVSAVAILWLVFLIAGLFYVIHLPMSVFCELMNDKKIFINYTDQTDVWDNKTWLDYKLSDYLPPHEHPLKIKEILDKCNQNKTLYVSMSMSKYWNITQYVEGFDLTINDIVWKVIVGKSIEDIQFPEGDLKELMEKCRTIVGKLDFPSSQTIIDDISEFDINNVENRVGEIIQKPPTVHLDKDVFDKLAILREQIKSIKIEKNSQILFNLKKFSEFKEHIKNILRKVIEAKISRENFLNAIHSWNEEKVPFLIGNISQNLKSIITGMESTIQKNAEAKIGNCYFLPLIYNKALGSICSYSLPITSSIWITMSLTSTFIIFCILCSCRMAGYIRGVNNLVTTHSCIWRQQYKRYRYSNKTAKLNTALLLDPNGKLLTIPIKSQTPPKNTASQTC